MDQATQTTQAPLAGCHLGFDSAVPNDGYRWWYLDAFSDDGKVGMTAIFFIGSVFSPYYFRARQRGATNAEQHCSANVIFYGPGRKRWAMTERGASAIRRDHASFTVGPSVISRLGNRLVLRLSEWCVPVPTRLQGCVTIDLTSLGTDCFALDDAGKHRWWPIAPSVTVRVNMTSPSIKWQGRGYLDSNAGVEPLERAFRGWHWQRSEARGGSGDIYYQTHGIDDNVRSLALTYQAGKSLAVQDTEALRAVSLGSTPIWRAPRVGLLDKGALSITKTYEDTPFYARSKLLRQAPDGSQLSVMHESLDLTRFTQPWVQRLLPFRMPRVAW